MLTHRRARTQALRAATTPSSSVADWVNRNRARVISYYPLNDAATGGTMNDAIGSLDGTYGSVVSATTIDGVAAADWSAITASGQVSFIADNAAFDAMMGAFAVVRFISLADANVLLQRRNSSDVTADRFQWFTNVAPADTYVMTNFGTPYVAIGTTTPFVTARTYTIGMGYDSGSLSLYINGVAVASNTTGNPFPAASPNRIDVGSGTVYAANQELDGAMCELVLLKSAPPSAFAELHRAWSS